MKKTIALSALSAMALTGFAYSQEDDTSVSTDFAVSYSTDYIFRGIDFGENLYTYSLDVAGTDFCGLDWSAGIWYAQFDSPLENADEELDIYGEVSKDFGVFSTSVGFVRYIFPDGDDTSNTEAYAGIGTEYAGFELGAKVYYNVDTDSGSAIDSGDLYYDLSADYRYEFSDTLSGSAGATVAFFDADGRFENPSESGYVHFTVQASLSYAASENISISPYVAYSDSDSDYYSSYGVTGGEDHFYGGVSVGYSF
jgi:hypothetical protein